MKPGWIVLLCLLGAAVLAALLADRRLLRRVDYSLLLTFLFFFVFVGNMNCLLYTSPSPRDRG